MARQSVLLSTHRDSLIIEDFIFHVILKNEDTPRYFNEVTFTDDSQRKFFTDLILAAAEGTQYVFSDREHSDFVRNCQLIIDDPKSNFVTQSKILTHSFHELHSGNVNDGVFVVTRVSMVVDNERRSFIALLKVDYARVYQQIEERNDNNIRITFKEIQESIAEDKSKIQKWALVDISNKFGWDVLAKQRGRSGKQADTPEAISDYFKRYLGVTERECDSNLTRAFVTNVFAWARQQEGLPECEIPNNYKARAISYMEATNTFDSEKFVDFVVRDDEPDRKEQLINSLTEYLRNQGLHGQVFSPKPDSLPKSQKKNTLKTEFGVTVIWEGNMNANGITIDDNSDQNYKVITIKTPNYDLT